MRHLTNRFTTALFVLTVSAGASAYCRSTTCPGGPPGVEGGCPRDENGCTSGDTPLAWASGCVGYSFHEAYTSKIATDEVRAAVRAAFDTWQNADCGGAPPSIAFVELPQVACGVPEYNSKGGANANAIAFVDAEWDRLVGGDELTQVVTSFESTTGAILDADVVLNMGRYDAASPATSFDLQAVMTHAVGHFIGLAHSGEPAAVMRPEYELGTTEGRDLSADDVAAVCAAYPPDRRAACDPEPRGGFAPACATKPLDDGAPFGCSVGAAGSRPMRAAALALATLTAALRRRRRHGESVRASSLPPRRGVARPRARPPTAKRDVRPG